MNIYLGKNNQDIIDMLHYWRKKLDKSPSYIMRIAIKEWAERQNGEKSKA